jgi:predicted Zn finger-like uncharacterized protein
MIVTCPSCAARYKIDQEKIKARGAKITCPSCSHKFVVYREGDASSSSSPLASDQPLAIDSAPSDIGRRDFRQVGIVWKVRKGIGILYDFHDLSTLREYLDDGQIDLRDGLSYDGREWASLESVGDLEAYFWTVWQRAEAGDIQVLATAVSEDADEDDSDAPTTIVGHGTSLADEIRKAVQDATTPAPSAERASGPVGISMRQRPREPVASPAAPANAAGLVTDPAKATPDPFVSLGKKNAQEQQK